MVLCRLTLALVALGLVGSPLSALFCPGTDPAAMACCQNNPQGCNKTGMSDGCCRTVPNDGNASGTLVKATHDGAQMHAVALIQVSASILFDLTAPAGRHPLVAVRHLPLDLPPPLLSTLRI
jgi:hypothetical protein